MPPPEQAPLPRALPVPQERVPAVRAPLQAQEPGLPEPVRTLVLPQLRRRLRDAQSPPGTVLRRKTQVREPELPGLARGPVPVLAQHHNPQADSPLPDFSPDS